MVTVLSLGEFERLLRNKELLNSTNIDFIKNNELKVAIKRLLVEKTGVSNPIGFITVVLSDDTSSISARILDKTNKFNQVLPRPKRPVYIHLSESTTGISIDPETLMQVEGFDLKDTQMQELIHNFFDDKDNGIRYFFVPSINVIHIEAVYYDPSLEEQIQQIRTNVIDYDLLYQPLNLF